MGCGWVANVRNDSVPIKTGVFFPQKVGFPIEKNESLLKVKKKTPEERKSVGKSRNFDGFQSFFKGTLIAILRTWTAGQGAYTRAQKPGD